MARRKKAETGASFQGIVARVYGIARTRADGDVDFLKTRYPGRSSYEVISDDNFGLQKPRIFHQLHHADIALQYLERKFPKERLRIVDFFLSTEMPRARVQAVIVSIRKKGD